MIGLETTRTWLEISPTRLQQRWQDCQAIAVPGLRWQSFLNQICLDTVLEWLEERFDQAPEIAFPAIPGLWTLVNGSAVRLGTTRLICIPSEAMDQDELRVPQEWVDHPDWVGDYYLAVEVDIETQALQVWGYSTHQTIKTLGVYDPGDRTYSLDGSEVIQDLVVFGVMQRLPLELTRSDVAPLPGMTAAQVGNLLQQLSDPAIALPRLEVSTPEWLGLLSQELWLRQLAESRQVPAHPTHSPIQLGQWLQDIFETGWQTVEAAFQIDPLAVGLRQQPTPSAPGISRVKSIALDAEMLPLRLVLTVELEPDTRRRIAIQVFPALGVDYLPAQLQLELKTIADEVIQSANASAESHYLQLRPFKCAAGRELRLHISIGDLSLTETILS